MHVFNSPQSSSKHLCLFVALIYLFSNLQESWGVLLAGRMETATQILYKDYLFSVNGFYQFYALIKLTTAFS